MKTQYRFLQRALRIGMTLVAALSVVLNASAPAAVFYTETFTTGADGWAGVGSMTVSYDGSTGDPSGALKGTFRSTPLALTGRFTAAGAGNSVNFMGDYYSPSDTLAFTGFTFDFYSPTIPPGNVALILGSGVNAFTYTLTPQIEPTTTDWYKMYVPLDYAAGWGGAGADAFYSYLSNVTSVAVQVNKPTHSAIAQSYYIDNFTLNTSPLFVPEPTSGLFWFGWALVFGGLRKKLKSLSTRSPYALSAAR